MAAPRRAATRTLALINREQTRLLALVLALTVMAALLALQPARAETLPYGQGLFWKIERDGAEPSYLFGTMHSTEKRVVEMARDVYPQLRDSRALLVELVDSEDMHRKVIQAMVRRDGRVLDQVVPRDVFQQIKETGYEFGFVAQQMRQLKTWAVAIMFSLPPSEASRVAIGMRNLDQVLQDAARNKGKELISLETVEEQLSVFNEMNEEAQLAFLTTVLMPAAAIETDFEKNLSFYLARDTGAMHREMHTDYGDVPPEMAQRFIAGLIDRRNRLMVQRMAPQLERGNVFIAIGALHLGGEAGILNLLEQRGYRLTRLD